MNEKQNTEFRAKITEDLQKILIEELLEKTGFNKKTGLLSDGGKRFTGMPLEWRGYGGARTALAPQGDCRKDKADVE